ncbi:MAG: GtrA family protein [Eubacteriales bacterium]|nr:GtrA family protein [Eubacteriales bacterium]
MSFLKKIFDASLLKFLLVGAANTLLSLGITFALYQWLHFGYWGSTAVAYVVTSITAFIFNRKFTFRSEESVWKSAVKFALVIGVCYVFAYSLAKPLVLWAGAKWFSQMGQSTIEKIALLVGQCIFTGCNYFGQKFFAFKKQGKKPTPEEK